MLKINKKINIEALYSAFETTEKETFSTVGERHNFWEIVYIVDGIAGIAEDERIYKLKKGDIIFHKPMEFHRIWSSEGAKLRFIIITFSSSVSDFDILGEGVYTLDEKAQELLREILNGAIFLMEFEDSVKNQLVAVNLENLLLNLILNQTPNTVQQKTKGSEHYKKIVSVMNENIDKSLTSEDIARLCHLSLSNLKKVFKTYSGIGVMEYFNNLKITHAMDMIDEGVPFYQISEALGFSSPNYFSECFKKRCSLTPSEFKRRYTLNKGLFRQNQ